MIDQLPPSNRLEGIKVLFFKELQNNYSSEDLQTFFRLMLEHYFGIRPSELIYNSSRRISESEILIVQRVIRKLKKQEPWQYIVGETEFYGLNIQVNRSVLIPRPETEEMIELIRKQFIGKPSPKRIIDLCSGSGCIALSLKKIFPEAKVYGLEICPEALKVARQNALKNQLEVEFVQTDLLNLSYFEESSQFDLIVSNPPYIMEKEKGIMAANVVEHEPHLALFVPDLDPLVFYKAIKEFAMKHLAEEGQIWLEINAQLGLETKLLFDNFNAQTILDLSGKDRFIRVL